MIARAQIACRMDTAFPRDDMVINPHFNNAAFLPGDEDWQDFAEDLAAAMSTYYNADSRRVQVKIYDAQGTVPVLPVGNAVVGDTLTAPSFCPRELSMCLSYYSGQNRPRRRGRLYVPVAALNVSTGYGRPQASTITKVLELGTVLKNAGGADVDWGLYSPSEDEFFPTTNYWVDDEWDTVRSRGMRPTSRQTATASE